MPDPNPIIDPGCPRSVGGAHSAAALCLGLGIPFKLRDLDCPPFFHGYGKNCSDPEPVVAIWDLPVDTLEGVEAKIPFYITPGDGPLLLGNELCHRSRLLGPENLMAVPPGVRGLSADELTFQTYTEPMAASDPDGVRTYLFVVPSKFSTFKTFFSSHRAYFATKGDEAFKKVFGRKSSKKTRREAAWVYTSSPG